MKHDQKIESIQELYKRGWTISETPKQLKVTTQHISHVFSGQHGHKKIRSGAVPPPMQNLILKYKKTTN